MRQYIALVQTGVVGVSAKDGSTLWEHRREEAFPDIVAPTPLFKDNSVYDTAWKGGCERLKLTADGGKFKAEVAYAKKEIASPHGGVVLANKCIFGNHDLRAWECQNLETGIVRWRSKPGAAGVGSLIYADGCLYTLSAEKGEVALLEASPDDYNELGRFTLPKLSQHHKPDGKVWAHPALSDGRLYLRDQELVYCYRVKAP